MKAIIVKKPGGSNELELAEYKKPIPKADEILIRVRAAALNRADILQRKGNYPPPKGASNLLGLEIAGKVVEKGNNVNNWEIDDEIFGLIPGGGYAEYAVIHKDMAMRIPSKLSYEVASAIPEVFLTAYQTLVWHADIKEKYNVLIHAGGSGVGTAAIQIVKEKRAHAIITASKEKHKKCIELGAEKAIDYKSQQFDEKVLKYTNGKGADIIIDFIGAEYFEKNMKCLNQNGKLIFLATLGGSVVKEFDIRNIMTKWISLTGSTLRTRPLDYQIKLTKEFYEYAHDKFESGKLKPVVDKIFSWQQVKEAHRYMEENKNTGKVVLKIE